MKVRVLPVVSFAVGFGATMLYFESLIYRVSKKMHYRPRKRG